MNSKSSKMIGWIKKRCRRRSDPFGDKLKYSEEKTITTDPIYFTLETNVSPKHSDKTQDAEDHIYEEISNSMETCVPRDIINEMLKMTKNIDVEFPERANHSTLCPNCRNIFPKDILCSCVEINKVSVQEDNIYELATNPWVCHYGNNRKLPDIPVYHREKKGGVEIPVCDDSSGYYESIGSDYSTVHVYSAGSEESGFDDDDDYEEVDVKPRILPTRRCSMSSFPLSLTSIPKFNYKTSANRCKTFNRKTTLIETSKKC